MVTEQASIRLTQGSPEWKALRRKAQTDLYWLAAKVLDLEDKIPMTLEAHYALCRFASRQTGIPEIDSARVQLIHVARGWGKSACVTTARTIQRLLQNRNWAAGILNEKADNAEAFLAAIKGHFEVNSFLQVLFPELIPDFRKTVWRSDRIVINRTNNDAVNPSVRAAGADTAVTSVHTNEWIVDDIISDAAMENARSGVWTEIDKTNRTIDRLEYLLKQPKAGMLTYIGTPWWPGDCYDYIQNSLYGKGEPQEFLWHLELPNGQFQTLTLIRKGELAIFRLKPIQDGRPIFPERYPQERLDALRRDNPTLYSAQVLLEPTADAAASFKLSWLREYEWEGPKQIRYRDHEGELHFERTPNLTLIMSVDPAISDKSSAARSAIIVTGSNGRFLFLLEAWARRCSPSDLATQILKLFKEYLPSRIIIESVQFQIALAEVLNLLAEKEHLKGLPIYEFKTGSQQRKQTRIASLEPYFKKGLIYWNPTTQGDFGEEVTNFSPIIGNRLVDLLDALSMQKESWDHLAMLGGDKEHDNRANWQEGQHRAISRIRKHYAKGRTVDYAEREWLKS